MTCPGCTRKRIEIPDVDPVGLLVSALMPTRNRRAFVPMAIESFLAQTYVPRELIVLDDGEDPAEDLMPTAIVSEPGGPKTLLYTGRQEPPKLDTWRLCYARSGPCKSATGDKLNQMIQRLARGSILAKWDDDDWRAPSFLSTVVPLLAGTALAGLQSAYFHEIETGKNWRLDQGGRTPVDGSIVFWRSTWEANPFPDTSLGEGRRFIRNVPKQLRATMIAPELYVAFRHGGNTTIWDPRPPAWQPVEGEPAAIAAARAALTAPSSAGTSSR